MRRLFAVLAFCCAAPVHAERVVESLAWSDGAPATAEFDWFTPGTQGAHATVIHFRDQPATSLAFADDLAARDLVYSGWHAADAEPMPVQRFREILTPRAGRHGIDLSRLVLMADASLAVPVLVLADALQKSDADLRLRGIVIDVDTAMDWPALSQAKASAPVMLIRYRVDQNEARTAAFALARQARDIGVAVMLLAKRDATDPVAAATTLSWMSALELPRVQRFDDARVSAYAGTDQDALLATLAALQVPPEVDADGRSPGFLASVSGLESGADEALFADAEGHIFRRSSVGTQALEFDVTTALSAVYGDVVSAVEIGTSAATELLHPETGEHVLALPVRVEVSDGGHSLLLLRRTDGSYAYADLNDERAVMAITPSPDAGDHGRTWFLTMAGNDAQTRRLLRFDLHRAAPRRGIWWDPSHPGHAIDLASLDGAHSLVFSTYDAAGKSRWYLASGRIEHDRFRANADGLLLMRRKDALAAPTADARHGGDVAIDFSIDATHPVCRARTATATQLALFSLRRNGRETQWCIEPFPLPAGVPEHDVNGTWFGGTNDSGWGLSLLNAGSERPTLVSALLYFYDAAGWPRWALGSGRSGEHGASLTMFDFNRNCADCKDVKTAVREIGELNLRFHGWCGAPEVRAKFNLGVTDDASIRFQRDEMPLKMLTQPRCY